MPLLSNHQSTVLSFHSIAHTFLRQALPALRMFGSGFSHSKVLCVKKLIKIHRSMKTYEYAEKNAILSEVTSIFSVRVFVVRSTYGQYFSS